MIIMTSASGTLVPAIVAPAAPACWPPSAANAPASAVNASNAGAARNLKLRNRAVARSWPAH